MKIKTQWLTRALLLCFITILPTLLLFAQGDPGGDPDLSPDNGVPLDGGVSLLVVAAIGYAAKKGYDKRKKTKAAQEEELNK